MYDFSETKQEVKGSLSAQMDAISSQSEFSIRSLGMMQINYRKNQEFTDGMN